MRKAALIVATLILTISICGAATAQTSPSSTQASASPAASNIPAGNTLSDEQVKAQLIADLKMFRDLYDLTKQERDAAVTALELEKSNSASLNKSYALAEREISTLNKALDRYAAAVALYEKSISMLETQRDEARADAKKAKKKAALTSVAMIGLIAMKFLF